MKVDPSRVSTAEELTAQLRALFEQSGKSYERFASDSGIGTSTLHELVNKSNSFPRRATVKAFVDACGQTPGPWLHAWERVDQARTKPARTSSQDLRAAVENLRGELEQARQQTFAAEVAREAGRQVTEQRISNLTLELASAHEELRAAQQECERLRASHATAAVLARIPPPTFKPARTDSAGEGKGYDSQAVVDLMERLRATMTLGLAATAQLLAFSALPHQRSLDVSDVGYRHHAYHEGFETDEVDAYLAALRDAVNEALEIPSSRF